MNGYRRHPGPDHDQAGPESEDDLDAFLAWLERTLVEASDVRAGLEEVAKQYLRVVTRPDVLRLRRLVIGEAARFPDVARAYYERVPGRVLETLAKVFARLNEEKRLNVADPDVAAQHFAWLVIGMPIDRGMFVEPEELRSGLDVARTANSAVGVFLSAYGR